ncbi:hypothetical protein [Roseinatronobacter monicus]|uniref:hypothetical protein n=1 Tax=Roseinatronobacter monicus TaxID=393481 RepID=UPI001154A519|nr:hypothetical protein [Roseinatronobacter monicus]
MATIGGIFATFSLTRAGDYILLAQGMAYVSWGAGAEIQLSAVPKISQWTNMRSVFNHWVFSIFVGVVAILAAGIVLGASPALSGALVSIGLIAGVTYYLGIGESFWKMFSKPKQGHQRMSALASRREFGKTTPSAPAPDPAQWIQRHSKAATSLDQRVFVISAAQSAFTNSVTQPLTGSGYALDILDCFDTALTSLRQLPQLWQFVFIDMDALEKHILIHKIVEELLQLRRDVPHIPIALVSPGFAADEFGTHRLHLADLSLAAPIHAGSLLSTLSIMSENNKLWQARLAAVNAIENTG